MGRLKWWIIVWKCIWSAWQDWDPWSGLNGSIGLNFGTIPPIMSPPRWHHSRPYGRDPPPVVRGDVSATAMEEAVVMLQERNEKLELLKNQLVQAQNRMRRQANKNRRGWSITWGGGEWPGNFWEPIDSFSLVLVLLFFVWFQIYWM